MRKAALAPLLIAVTGALSACTVAAGGPVDTCDASWRRRDAQIVEPGGVDARTVPIECMRGIERRRLRIGFRMPPGPDCHHLTRIDVIETGESVAVTLWVARSTDPTVGACAEEEQMVRTEIDLQQAVGGRTLLDGSRQPSSTFIPSGSDLGPQPSSTP